MLKEHETQEQLRELSKNTLKKIKVWLPDCKPSEFYKADIEVPFVDVKLAKLLYFIADMM